MANVDFLLLGKIFLIVLINEFEADSFLTTCWLEKILKYYR